jgi:hypothetical protein
MHFFLGSENNPCTGSKEGWFHCECSHTCIPPNEGNDPENPLWAVCNGKNDCCGTIHGVLSQGPKECADNNKANYTALDELQENGEPCVTECPEGEIQCLHENDNPLPLKCIPADKRCNGVNDCGTFGENDEMQENGEACITTCGEDTFQCSTDLPLECVPQEAYCKRLKSCSNGMEFKCPPEWIIDYCPDVENKNNAEYLSYDYDNENDKEFACIDENNRFLGNCTSMEKKCDGHPDCSNAIDEKNCTLACDEGEIQCVQEDGKKLPLNCISQDDYCMGAKSCPHGNDFLCSPQSVQTYCNAFEEFACINAFNVFLKACIPKEKKCDGNPDCPNRKDEEGCVDSCDVEKVQCIHENGKKLPLQCILPSKHCDGISDCKRGEDEMGCECVSETFRLECI